MADQERARWKGRFEFVFTSFGYVIGLGNIWRFPYACYKNGGGVFLLPYFITYLLCVYPVAFLEMSLGQFASTGPVKIWSLSPLFAGVGWAILFNLLLTVIYYNVLVMFGLYYMLVSMVTIGGKLPWQACRPEDDWSTENCRSPPVLDTSEMTSRVLIQTSLTIMNTSCVDAVKSDTGITNLNDFTFDDFKLTFSGCKFKYETPEEQYWNRFVLGEHESDGLDRLGPINGRNAFMLLITWVVVYYCCIRGIRSLSRVIYFTATFPFLLLLILLVLGFTLDGYEEGLRFYMTADWSKLSDLKIWANAGTQAMFSVGISYGSLIALSSYNNFSNNIVRDSLLITAANIVTSIFCGFVVFCFLGHASLRLDKPIEDVFDQGPGILFISYIQGITKLPGSAIWSFLFFLMVFTLGLDSQFVMFWTFYDAIQEQFPKIFKPYGRFILPCICFVLFLLGLPLVTNGGIHMVVLMDTYLASFNLVILVLLECVSVCWVYGFDRFISNVEQMIGKKSKYFWYYWKLTLMVASPLFCVFLFIASVISYDKASYKGREAPGWGQAIGILMIITPVLIIIGCALIQIRRYGSIMEAIKPRGPWRVDSDNGNIRKQDGDCYDRPNDDQVKSESDNFVFQTETPIITRETELSTPQACVPPSTYTEIGPVSCL